MTKLKFFYYLTILIVIAVTAVLVFFLLFPAWQYTQKSQNQISFSEPGERSSSSSIQWIADSTKSKYFTSDDLDADLLIFRNTESFTTENLKSIQGKILIFEQLYSQISENIANKAHLDYLTGINYSGFAGATFEDLGDTANIPEKIVELYEKTTGIPWRFFGEGIVLSNDESVIVLRRGVDYSGSVQLIADGMKINYQGIFEITDSKEKLIGQFSIHLKESGKELFAQYGLPSTFPAAYHISRNLFEAYYFTGNFSSFQVDVPFTNSLMPKLMKHKLLYSGFSNEEVFWRWYYPILEEIVVSSDRKKDAGEVLVALNVPKKTSEFSVSGQDILITNPETTSNFFIKGVNLGTALPGRYFTEFPESKETYLDWFGDIQDLNLNTIRVYTLLPPVFYQAFYEFNLNNPDPLYLLQEIWPEEHPENADLLNSAYNEAYHQEIEYAVHAIHGNIQIPERKYRAFGIYSYDVSPYLMGYLVGREVEPEEVIETDRLNKGYRFQGEYFYSKSNATPSESWLAASCDYAMAIEDAAYQNKPLIAIVSWPTLDPLVHQSEWIVEDVEPYNDKAVVNINNIGVQSDKVAGFFGAYHIYPNYPDFMNNESEYANYFDDVGSFRYGGYLQEFMEQHTRYPAVIAEYGIATSSVTAHFNPDGLNHGGMDEAQQADGIIRMTQAIIQENYSGAIIFEWMDEWAKKTWTTELFMIPYDRHVLWHNVLDPEQNYGLLAYQVAEPEMKEVYVNTGDNHDIQIVSIGQDAEYLDLQITCSKDCDDIDPLSFAISTYNIENEKDPVWEFIVHIDETPELLVNPDYNWLEGKYASSPYDFSEFRPLIQITNAAYLLEDGSTSPELTQNLSDLKSGAFNNNENEVFFEDNLIRIRIPYGLLGVADPSSKMVLFDERIFIPTAIDQIGTQQTDEIMIRVIQNDEPLIDTSFTLTGWEIPPYTERLKDSYNLLSDYYGQNSMP